MCLSLHKFLQILFNFYHFRCLRMQLTLSSARLHGKPRLIPSSYAIARHKDRRITANEVFVIGNFAFETIGLWQELPNPLSPKLHHAMLAFGAAVLDKQSFLYLNPCEILHKKHGRGLRARQSRWR